MIKLVAVIARKPDWNDAQWYSHYHYRHGPLVAATRGFTQHTIRYRQNYVLGEADGEPVESTRVWNGVTELWFQDMSALASAFTSADYQSTIRPDEDRFANRERIIAGVGTENLPYSRPVAPLDPATAHRARIHLFVFRPAGQHSAVVADQLQAVPADSTRPPPGSARQYVQTRFVPADLGFATEQCYAAVDEFWFDSEHEGREFQSSRLLGGHGELSLLTRSHVVFDRD